MTHEELELFVKQVNARVMALHVLASAVIDSHPSPQALWTSWNVHSSAMIAFVLAAQQQVGATSQDRELIESAFAELTYRIAQRTGHTQG